MQLRHGRFGIFQMKQLREYSQHRSAMIASYAFSISRSLPNHSVAHNASPQVLSFTRVLYMKSSCAFAETMVFDHV